ncbi:MAG TPA: hypothetical protein VL172_11855 [Kofleriaceae bacterium]|nr:hypothetical protein [Kofleriaceae bacterium]
MWRVLALLLGLTLGCSAREADAAGCADRADAIGRALGANPHGTQLADPGGAPTPPAAQGRPDTELGYVILIDAGGRVRVDGRDLGTDRPALRRWVDDDLEKSRLLHRRQRRAAYLWADRTATVATLVDVAQALPADLDLRLVVADPAPPPGPEPRLLKVASVQGLKRTLEASRDGGERATAIAHALQASIAPCAPLVRVFGQVAEPSGESKATFMAREVPRALQACKCRMADFDLTEYALLALSGIWDRRFGWLPLPSPKDLAARRAASVADLAAVLAGR